MNAKTFSNLENTKEINLINNIQDYIIEIDYFDKNGNKKYKNNIPLKYILNKKLNTN